MEQSILISAGIVVRTPQGIVLVCNQSNNNEKFYSIPKGLKHKNENILCTALRETHEETGLKIKESEIAEGPFVMNMLKGNVIFKRIFYYITKELDITIDSTKIIDAQEISDIKIVSFAEIKHFLIFYQWPILWHLQKGYVDPEYLYWLLQNNFISRVKHPTTDYFLYNYTKKCKDIRFWNEFTLNCRGLILDNSYKVIAKPFKKFFEYNHVYDDLMPLLSSNFDAYKKIDGALGITYWYNDLPHITSKTSFLSIRSFKATNILYNKYSTIIPKLNKEYTYLFEILIDENKQVVNYNEEDIILIGVINRTTHQILPLSFFNHLGFKMPECVSIFSLDELKAHNFSNEEGYVLYFHNKITLKIKFDWYYKEYKNKNLQHYYY